MNGPRPGMSAILPAAPGAGVHPQKGQKMNLTKKMLAALIGLALALGFVTPAHAAKPRIVTQPVAGKYTEGQTITLKVKATGKKKKYQWQVRYAWEPRWQNIRPSWTKNGTAKKSTLKIRARLSDDRAKFRVKVTHRVKTKSGKTVKRTMTSKAVRVKVKAKKVTPRPTPSPTPSPTPTPTPVCWYEDVEHKTWIVLEPGQPAVEEKWEQVNTNPYIVLLPNIPVWNEQRQAWVPSGDFIDWYSALDDPTRPLAENPTHPYEKSEMARWLREVPGTKHGTQALHFTARPPVEQWNFDPETNELVWDTWHTKTSQPGWQPDAYGFKYQLWSYTYPQPAVPEEGYWFTHYTSEEFCS